MFNVEDYPDYEVFYDGSIWSHKFGKLRKLKENLDKNGYITVSLWNKGKMKTHRLHILIAKAFIPNPENLPQVNHMDGDKANPSGSNLEWATNSDNQIHAFNTGLQKTKITDKIALAIYRDTRVQSVIAQEYNVDQALVSRIKSGKRWNRVTNHFKK